MALYAPLSPQPTLYSPPSGAYLITLTQYYDYTNTSEQYQWFSELASALDRTRFPWLIVMHHAPLYNTLISHYVEGECFRKVFEPLFFKYGVDFVLTGKSCEKGLAG